MHIQKLFSPTYCLGEAGSGKGKTFDVETFILTQNQHSSSEPIFVVLTFLFSLKDHKVIEEDFVQFTYLKSILQKAISKSYNKLVQKSGNTTS